MTMRVGLVVGVQGGVLGPSTQDSHEAQHVRVVFYFSDVYVESTQKDVLCYLFAFPCVRVG